MVTKASLNYVRISPRKFRQVIPIVKGKNPETAILILSTVKKGASKYAIDLLKSAVANAKRIQGVDVANLFISRFVANGGPQLKRFRAASMGRASHIRKRTSHIIVELDEMRAPQQATPAAAPVAAEKSKIKKPVTVKSAEKGAVEHEKSKKQVKAKPVKPDAGKKGKE
jgi:large subunit ribosomal protein L22